MWDPGHGDIRKSVAFSIQHSSSYKIPTLYIKTSPQHWYPHPSAYLFLPPSLLCRTLPLPLIPLIPRLRKSQASTSYDPHLSHRQNHLPRQNQPPSQDEIDQGSNRTAHRSRCMLVEIRLRKSRARWRRFEKRTRHLVELRKWVAGKENDFRFQDGGDLGMITADKGGKRSLGNYNIVNPSDKRLP